MLTRNLTRWYLVIQRENTVWYCQNTFIWLSFDSEFFTVYASRFSVVFRHRWTYMPLFQHAKLNFCKEKWNPHSSTRLFVLFIREYICDFLVAFLHTNSLLKMDLIWNERTCFFRFRLDPFQKEGKNNLPKLFLLKVYVFLINLIIRCFLQFQRKDFGSCRRSPNYVGIGSQLSLLSNRNLCFDFHR